MITEPATVLVVDDTDTKRYIISSWLRRAGHEVVEAASAAETWQQMAEIDVDVVVLDVRLPDMSGLDVCERLKADPDTAIIPVIHVSASAVDVADRTRGLKRGADAYMIDPIDPDEFIATVEAVLRYYRARRHAERMAQRMAALTQATLAIHAADSFDRLALAAARGATQIFEVPACVFVLPVDGRLRRTVALRPDAQPWMRGGSADVLDALGTLALGERAGTEVALVARDRWLAALPDAAIHDDVSIVVSRTKPGRPSVCVAVQARGALDEEEFNLLRQFGLALALAVEALRSYAEEHTIALTLQRSLLPRTPHIPGMTFAVRYEPVGDTAEVGGDFYEVIDLGDRVLVAIGDVQGHSLHAATVMAELRHALRAFADEGHNAVDILFRLNSVLQRYHDDQTATVCLMTFDPVSGTLEVASAGHIPPLLIVDGRAWYGKGGGVLIGFPAEGVGVEHLVLPPGGTVVLITDGLVEDRGVSIEENLERLRVLATGIGTDTDLEEFSDRILSEFGHREDDVALVALRRDGSG